MAINLISKKDNISKSYFPEAVIIAVFTGMLYVGAFIYKMAYLSFYNINSSFVDIDISDILSINSFALLAFVEITYIFIYIVIKKKKSKRNKLIALFGMLFLTLLPLILEVFIKSNYLLLASLILFIVLLAIFKKYLKNKDVVMEKIKNKFGIFPFLIFIFISLYCGFCYSSGLFNARSQENYFIIKNGDNYLAVIAPYDKSFLCVPFNNGNKVFSENITILTQDTISNSNLFFVNKKVGPLRYQKNN